MLYISNILAGVPGAVVCVVLYISNILAGVPGAAVCVYIGWWPLVGGALPEPPHQPLLGGAGPVPQHHQLHHWRYAYSYKILKLDPMNKRFLEKLFIRICFLELKLINLLNKLLKGG